MAKSKLTNEEIIALPLDKLLLDLNYTKDNTKSSKNFLKLKGENGDSIIITKNTKGHYLYWNPINDDDKGNIFNFCKNRNIKLLDLIEGKDIESLKKSHTLKANKSDYSNKEIQHIIENFKGFKELKKFNYFNNQRAISNDILNILKQDIKMDKCDNICIPTYTKKSFSTSDSNLKELYTTYPQTGYQTYLKNPIINENQKTLKQICYGIKGLEILKFMNQKPLNTPPKFQNLILTESTIDSLSLLELLKLDKTPQNTLICATNGTITKSQLEILESLKNNLSIQAPQMTFILGFDNDTAGAKNTQKAMESLKNTKTQILTPITKDFNDDLILLKILNLNEISQSTIESELKQLNEQLKDFNQGGDYLYKHFKEKTQNEAIKTAGKIDFALKKVNLPQELKKSLKSNLNTFNEKYIEQNKITEEIEINIQVEI